MDRHGVLARLRRVPAARRTGCRRVRPPPRVHARHGAVHVRLAHVRPRGQRRVADRVPRRAGPRRRDRLARDPLDHQRGLPPRRRGAEQGVRDLGRDRGERRGGRRAPRRRPHGVPRLGVDLLRQRARGHRGHRAHDRGSSRRAAPRTSTRTPTRSPRSSSPRGSSRSSTPCPRRPKRAGSRCRRSGSPSSPSSSSPPSSSRRRGPTRRSCRSGSSACATWPSRTGRALPRRRDLRGFFLLTLYMQQVLGYSRSRRGWHSSRRRERRARGRGRPGAHHARRREAVLRPGSP